MPPAASRSTPTSVNTRDTTGHRLFFETATDGMLLADAEERILDANPVACRLLRRAREELVGSALGELVDPSYLAAREGHDGRTFKGGVRLLGGDGTSFAAEVSFTEGREGQLGLVFRGATECACAGENLRQGEHRYAAVVESGLDLITVCEPDNTIRYVSPSVRRILGYEPEELVGAFMTDLVHPEDLKLSVQEAHEILANPEHMPLPVRYRRKDGSYAYLETVFKNMLDDPGVRGIVVNCRDITERKEAEERLHESEERFRLLAEVAQEGIVLSENGTILDTNESFSHMFGYGPEEVIGMDVVELVTPEDRELAAWRVSSGNMGTYEARGLKKDGTVFPIEVRPEVIPHHGKQVRVASVLDLTERRQTEEDLRRSLGVVLALREAGQILGSTLESKELGTRLLKIIGDVFGLTTAVINVVDERGQLRVWHATGLEGSWRRAHHAPEAEGARRAVLETGEHRSFQLQWPGSEAGDLAALCLPLRTRNRTIGVLEAYGLGDQTGKDAVGILGSLANQAASALENSRLYEELAERETRLEELVGKLFTAQEKERRQVAYEVHDGLAQVAAAAHQHLQAFARFHPPDSEGGRTMLDVSLELIQRTVGDARQLIANLRPTALDDFGLQTVIRLEVEALRAEGWRIGYEGTLREGERLPVAVETTLFRVAQEALTNIRKHANTKWVRLSLDRLGEKTRLSVQDWGRGFDPATPPPDSDGPGKRVGLPGMRERVALHGGELEIQSRPGAGTLVTAEIPLPE